MTIFPTDSKEGDLCVWWLPQVGMDARPFSVPVKGPEEAAIILNTLAEYDAYQLVNNVKPDYSNAGGLVVFEDGEWVDWQDDTTFEDDPKDVYPQPALGWCEQLNDL